MSTTARTIIQAALSRINAIGPTDTLSPEDATVGMRVLNSGIVGSWKNHPMLQAVQSRATYPMVAMTNTYTLGATGTLVGARLTEKDIEDVAVIPVGQTVELDAKVLSRQEYNGEPLKTSQTQDFFTKVHIEPTVPNSTVIVLPIPTTTCTLVMYARGRLTAFATLDTAYDLEDGYEWAFITNLAELLCPEYEEEVTAALHQQAVDAKAAIMTANEDVPTLEADGGGLFSGGGGYNIRGDSFQR